MSKYILGIDPGLSGGIAVLGDEKPHAFRMPETKIETLQLLKEWAPDVAFCWIEKAQPRPAYVRDNRDVCPACGRSEIKITQGIVATATFLSGYGVLIGFLLALDIHFEEVRPQDWQKLAGCMTHGDKNISKIRAQKIFPTLTVTHCTADALLIAEQARLIYETGQAPKRKPAAAVQPSFPLLVGQR